MVEVRSESNTQNVRQTGKFPTISGRRRNRNAVGPRPGTSTRGVTIINILGNSPARIGGCHDAIFREDGRQFPDLLHGRFRPGVFVRVDRFGLLPLGHLDGGHFQIENSRVLRGLPGDLAPDRVLVAFLQRSAEDYDAVDKVGYRVVPLWTSQRCESIVLEAHFFVDSKEKTQLVEVGTSNNKKSRHVFFFFFFSFPETLPAS